MLALAHLAIGIVLLLVVLALADAFGAVDEVARRRRG